MRKYYWIGLVVIIVLVAGAAWLFATRSRSVFTKEILSQVNFLPLAPTAQDKFTIDPGSIKYDKRGGVFTFVAISADKDIKFTLSEQPTPAQFNDIPEYYTKLTEKLGVTSNFSSSNGTVYLVHPPELPGQTVAVMNARGVLLFAKPDHTPTEDQWRQLFNYLEVVK